MAALFSVLLASCTSAGGPSLTADMPGYNAAGPYETTPSTVTEMAGGDSELTQATGEQPLIMAEGDPALPEQVAYFPTANPALAFASADPAAPSLVAETAPQALEQASQSTEPEQVAVQAGVPTPLAKPDDATQPVMDNPVYVTAGEAPQPQAAAPKKKGFLASLFGASPAEAAPAPAALRSADKPAAKPIITLASAEPAAKPLMASAGAGHVFGDDALPGVRRTALFEITRKSGIDDDSDVDLNEDEGGLYQVASAAGLARLAPNGLLKQTEGVDVACLKPSLVRVLKTIESHYGKKMIVTSGYRDPSRNRRARGAKNSLHMYCAAADIQLPGVDKWELANFVRSMPGRGGVGTYCHTDSVHIDVGPERDWNWRCRRRK